MADPDLRRARLEALRLQLEPLALRAMQEKADSPEQAALSEQVSEVLWAVMALREELEG